MLRFLTAGESHGKGLVVILEGMPAGLHIDFDAITEQLKRRQGGYGRGRRMAIESDKAEVLSGVRAGETLGSPISLLIRNKDWENWQQTMHAEDEAPAGATGTVRPVVTRPRPGHADLAGAIKYDRTDIRDVLERASARETAARVAAGAIARQLLADVRRRDRQPRLSRQRHRPRLSASRHVRSGARHRRRLGASLRRSRCRGQDDRGDRSLPRRRRYRRRRVRSDRARPAGRPGQLRAMGSQARRPARAGDDVDSRHQGRRHRHRSEGRVRARLADARRDRSGARAARSRRSASRGRRTTPAGSKAASPTARI